MAIATERLVLADQGLDIVHREAWGAVRPYQSSRPVEQAIALFLHISVTQDANDLAGTERENMRLIEHIGQQRFSIGFPYNAAAFDTGRLYEGQPLSRRGAHTVNDKPNPAFRTGGLNHLVRALVLPQMVTDDVTDAQLDAAARWGAALCRSGLAVRGARWWGHRDVTAKSCPGPIAYARLDKLNALTRHYEANGLRQEESMADAVARIIWYTHTAPITRKVTAHAYVVRPSGIAKHLNKSGLAILRAVGTPEDKTRYGPEWQNNMAILDGPCKNV